MNQAVALDFRALFAGVVRRYRGCGRAASAYVAAKLRWDPVHRDMLRLAMREPFGTVVDVGCGHGQMGIALLQAGLATAVHGIDCNEAHLRCATAAAALVVAGTSPAMTIFLRQDLAQSPALPTADTVLLVDVLYQLDTSAQLRLLGHVAQAARRLVLIRTLDPDRGLRSAVTVILEKLLRRISPNSGTQVNPLPIDRIAHVLADKGFRTSVSPCWRGTPFANVLVTARRAPVSQSADA